MLASKKVFTFAIAMPYFISNIQPNVKKLQNYLAVPNNFVNTHR
ncbi:hypothetical protein B739_0650 [Riemerella anatipestifer RA-CH-1]|uniref:Uncharacterized protein n=1 Tax=Riemerella anatipestifer RA-CH-1 TaxID=1228997 RepID=J9R0M2_RIEAN|nr:hypothetical protein B739_0650 [Riemerella anatipestifer RA-CH-1]AIH02275.1 hypothetical protein M949_1106 [Riemerella anatipestifer CH3]